MMDTYEENMLISYVFRTLSLKIHQFTKRTQKLIKYMKWNFSCHFPGQRLDRIKWSDHHHNESHLYKKKKYSPLFFNQKKKTRKAQLMANQNQCQTVRFIYTNFWTKPMVENVICRCVMSAGIDDLYIYSNALIWWYPAFDWDQIERRSAMHLRFFRSYMFWMSCAYITDECKINVCVPAWHVHCTQRER